MVEVIEDMLTSERRFEAFEEKNISSTMPVILASGSERRDGTDGSIRVSDSAMLSYEGSSIRSSCSSLRCEGIVGGICSSWISWLESLESSSS